MLTFLLVLFVIALAIAPLLNFLPSPRQREIARMREYAAVHGLFVEFRHAPSEAAVPGSVRNLIYYGKRLPSSRADTVELATWTRAPAGWRSVGRRVPVPAPLLELSLEVVAASVDQFSCGVYWIESGGEAGVEQIRQTLERWCELLTQ